MRDMQFVTLYVPDQLDEDASAILSLMRNRGMDAERLRHAIHQVEYYLEMERAYRENPVDG